MEEGIATWRVVWHFWSMMLRRQHRRSGRGRPVWEVNIGPWREPPRSPCVLCSPVSTRHVPTPVGAFEPVLLLRVRQSPPQSFDTLPESL